MAGNGKKALVTGAGSGVGRAAALALLEKGYDVALVGRRKGPLEETAGLAGPGGGQAVVLAGDIGDPAAVDQIFAKVEETFGRLDVLFNNAGTNAPAVPIDELTVEQWHSVIGVNLTGAFLCARAAFGLMKRQQPHGGRIINNGSISAHTPRPNSSAYTASKHAITGLTKCLSLDGRKHDIACGQVDIGNAATPMTERMTEGVPQADGSIKPEPRMDVEHVARSVVFMAELPLETNVQFLTVMATKMPFVGRG